MTQTGRLVRSSAETPRKIPVRFGRATHYHSRSGGFQEPVSNVPSPVRRSGSTSFRRTPEPANPSFRRRPEPRGVGGTPSVAHEVEPSTLDNRRPMQKPQPATPVIPNPDRGSRRKPDPPIRRSGEGRNLGVWATTPVVQGSAGPCSRQNLATQPSKISSWAPQCHTEHPDVIPSEAEESKPAVGSRGAIHATRPCVKAVPPCRHSGPRAGIQGLGNVDSRIRRKTGSRGVATRFHSNDPQHALPTTSSQRPTPSGGLLFQRPGWAGLVFNHPLGVASQWRLPSTTTFGIQGFRSPSRRTGTGVRSPGNQS